MHPRNPLTAPLSLIFEGLDWPVTFSLLAKAPALFTIVLDWCLMNLYQGNRCLSNLKQEILQMVNIQCSYEQLQSRISGGEEALK